MRDLLEARHSWQGRRWAAATTLLTPKAPVAKEKTLFPTICNWTCIHAVARRRRVAMTF